MATVLQNGVKDKDLFIAVYNICVFWGIIFHPNYSDN